MTDTQSDYTYACYTHADLRNKTAKEQAEAYSTAYEQLDRPLLHVVQTGRFCALTNPGPSSVKCEGPIFRWRTKGLAAPTAKT